MQLFLNLSNRERADEVLKSAKNVVQSLEEADAAQTKARNAIKLSNEDIALARADLEQVNRKLNLQHAPATNIPHFQIDGETGEAHNKADDTSRKVNQLGDKLNELQKKFLKNNLDANEIKNQSDQVRDSASNAHDLATQVCWRAYHHNFQCNSRKNSRQLSLSSTAP